MQFTERVVPDGARYEVDDLFGTIRIEAQRKLEPKELDAIVLVVLKHGTPTGTIENLATWAFERNADWMPENGKERTLASAAREAEEQNT